MSPKPNRIGRYEIKSPIGGGGMGTLYLARDTNPTTDRLVALKLLKAHLDSADLRARFAREAQSLARLNHPNIVDIYDSGEFQDAPFIVMEYVRGETLAEKIKRKAELSLRQKLKLLIELCSGLAHAHEAGVIHRDVKPANLMVDQQGRLKIVDFGISRVADALTQVGAQLTQLNMQIGTPGYMSPEQIEGNDVDHRCDIFSVGAVAYELLSGHEAFSGANTKQVERSVLQAQPAPLVSLVADLDPAVADIVTTALEKDPNRRYQDAQSMEEALQQQYARLASTDTPVHPRVTPQPGQGKGHVPRAEIAYRHAASMVDEGAPETARRYLLEALAEDPNHLAAATLLSQLEGQRPRLAPVALADFPSHAELRGEKTAHAPRRDRFPSGDAGQLEPTIVVQPQPSAATDGRKRSADMARRADDLGRSERTNDDSRRDKLRGSLGSHQDPTVVIRPTTKTALPRMQTTPQPKWDRPAALWDPREWARQTLLVVIAIPVGLAAVAGGVWLWQPWNSGYRVTVTTPVGGTITANGIACGARGTTCSASFSNAEMLEFEAQAEEGFTFSGFTGDCAPSGRTMMNAPRECGATFERADVLPTAADDVLLTIAAPLGGTIVGQGVLCGSQGKECSGRFSAGFVVELQGHADEGYVFQGFSGDCGPDGKAVMVGPRTCGATFVGGRPATLTSAGPAGGAPTGPLGSGGNRTSAVRPGGPGGPGSAAPVGPSAGPANMTGAGAGGPAPTAVTTGPAVASAEDPSKPVREILTREAASRALIAETLEKYLAAYGRLDYQDLLSVYPTAPRNIRVQLAQYQALDYTFGGPPRFLKFDPDAGSALIELDFKQLFKPKVGGAQPPNEGRVTFQMHRLQNDDWVIDTAQFKGKK